MADMLKDDLIDEIFANQISLQISANYSFLADELPAHLNAANKRAIVWRYASSHPAAVVFGSLHDFVELVYNTEAGELAQMAAWNQTSNYNATISHNSLICEPIVKKIFNINICISKYSICRGES